MATPNATSKPYAPISTACAEVIGLRDELDQVEQREQLALWIEGARRLIDDLQVAFQNFPQLRKQPGMGSIAFPDGWNECMSGALALMHIENSEIVQRACLALDQLGRVAAEKVSSEQEVRHV